MMRHTLIVCLAIILLPAILADDAYQPYLHNPTIPEHPSVRVFGQYNTQLFPGAATYSYPIAVPPGTHGLEPLIAISYNSQATPSRPGILGTGWSLNQN